jgi:hypothetical protein
VGRSVLRVIFVTHYFVPEVGAPQRRIERLAGGLAERGADVTVHTLPPHYPTGTIAAPYRNRPLSVETRAGVRVVRSAVYPAANRGVARRLLNHGSGAASILATAPWAGPADVVVAETPPLFTAAAAVAYSRAKRAPLVLNVADRWPQSAVELGALSNRHAIAAATWLEERCYRAASAITVPTRGLERDLGSADSARGKVVQMPPAVDLERFDPAPPAPDGPLRVLYAGTVGMAQGIGTLIEAARRAGPSAVHVVIAGDGAEAAALAADRPENVDLIGPVPHDRVPDLYRQADVAAVLLRDRPIFAGALPTKTLEAMAAGRPVVLSGRGEAADLVAAAGVGVVVAPEDPHALADAFVDLSHDPERLAKLGAAGRRLAESEYGREQSVERWWRLLQGVASGRTPASS